MGHQVGNLFLTPLAQLVHQVHRDARGQRQQQALAVDSQGNVELLPTVGTAAEQAVARRGREVAGFVGPRCDRRAIALLVLRRMTELVEKHR